MNNKRVQINHSKEDPEHIYLYELKDFCKYFTQCPLSLKVICRDQCERVGYVDCNMLNEFIKDLRGIRKNEN